MMMPPGNRGMLSQLPSDNRAELVDRCQAKAAQRSPHQKPDTGLLHGIAAFVDQLIRTLRIKQSPEPMRSRLICGPSDAETAQSEMGKTADKHGRELLEHGVSVDGELHIYGDLCQAITGLAVEQDAPIATDELQTLNRCLDNALAVAVAELGYPRDTVKAVEQSDEFNERLGSLAHELSAASVAYLPSTFPGIRWRFGEVEKLLENPRSVLCRPRPPQWAAGKGAWGRCSAKPSASYKRQSGIRLS